MKGYIPVVIPTKKYVAAYIRKQLGEKPYMKGGDNISQKLYDVLQHKTNERKKEFANARYNDKLKIYLSHHTFTHRGSFLNETNLKNFNLYVERELKQKFYDYMDFYIGILPNFAANLPEVRKKLGIDIEAWSDDSMKKDYYRYRLENGLPLLYAKNTARTVPSAHFTNFSSGF